MLAMGYTLSCEEHPPGDLIGYARRAEEAGFAFATISDHFHSWIDRQGHSPFVWAVLGGIAQATRHLKVGTAVTCPTIRIHPAIIAQAAATTALMMPGRFFLGLGTGEYLNEHIFGDRWPPGPIRLAMLEEALQVIRLLWQGGMQSHRGRYYTVEDARIYSLPEEPPAIAIAAGGSKTAALAGRSGCGLISVGASAKLVKKFTEAGGENRPRYGQLHVCWARSEEEAKRIAREQWPISALPGSLFNELRKPSHFEQLSALADENTVAEKMPCGPDPEAYLAAVNEYERAGYDHISIHQIGKDQEGFFRFYEKELRSKIR